MKAREILDHPLAAALPGLAILGALAAAAGSAHLAPRGSLPAMGEMLGLLAVGVLAASYQPWRNSARISTLGLAAMALPLALERHGGLPAALVAGLVVILIGFARRVLDRRGARRRGDQAGLRPGRMVVEDALLVAGAVLLAGLANASWTADTAERPAPSVWLAPAAVYLMALVSLLVLRWLVLAPNRPDTLPEWRRNATVLTLPALLDAAGWAIGALLHGVVLTGGWPHALGLMAALALVTAEATRNARMRREAEARVADLERLQHAHKRILAEISGMGGIAQQILTECRNVLPVQWFQFEQPLADGSTRSWAAGPDGVLVEGEPHPEKRPPALPGVHRRASWRVLEKDLRAEERTLAAVRLWCDPRRVEAGAEQLFSTLVPLMASSVHRAELDREAKIDPLTGVPVRRMLENRLQRAYRLCLEEGWSMAVILCDIDHFKKINDTYGHVAGDEALKVFAKTLDTHRRENDLCCRYGGEEFTLLLENTNGEAALRLAERLRIAVEAVRFEYEGQHIPMTFSSGVAAFPELHVKTASELLLLADEALYQAKEQGRNRCLLNVGLGAYRAVAGRTIRTREAPPPSKTPRFFG